MACWRLKRPNSRAVRDQKFSGFGKFLALRNRLCLAIRLVEMETVDIVDP